MLGKIKILLKGINVFLNDYLFFVENSNIGISKITEAKLLSTLIASYHIIEKGLSMPNRRLGFGRDVMKALIRKCNDYASKYGVGNEQFQYAIAIIKEYDNLHKQSNYSLDEDLQLSINKLINYYDYPAAMQTVMSKEEFFGHTNDSFDLFSSSRHSTRHFSGKVETSRLLDALDLAKNAPSACNKQIVKSYIITNPDITKKILDLQQGNRGFGHLIDKLIVITTKYCGCTRYSDRFYPFVDAGIYSMNVLYSLHFYKIGAIPLVWLSTKERDKQLRKYIDAKNEEIPSLIIGVGDIADNVICANSPRKSIKETVIVR